MNPWNKLLKDTTAPRISEEYITQISEEIDCTETKSICQEFSTNESRIPGALSKVNDFLLNSKVHVKSATVSGASRETNRKNQERDKDRSQNDPDTELDATVDRSPHTVNTDLDAALHTCRCKVRPSESFFGLHQRSPIQFRNQILNFLKVS